MKKLIAMIMAVILLGSLSVTAFAEETEVDVYVKYITEVSGKYTAELENGSGRVVTGDGAEIAVSGAPENAKTLVVIPAESEAKAWIKGCVGAERSVEQAWAVYFEDAEGNKLSASSALVTVSDITATDEVQICSVSTDGTAAVLEASVQNGSVSFTANGSEYYAATTSVAEEPEDKVVIETPEGGRVEISDETPEPGDRVVITVTPDEGKEVDEVVVRDEDGKKLPVTDNGDGTYSYEQPEGTVTIEVTFRDEKPEEEEPTRPSWKDWLETIFEKWWGYEEKCDHEYSSVVTSPTCTEKGYTTHICEKCGDTYKDSYTNARGHAWDDSEVTMKATYTENDTKTFTCETCGTTKPEVIKAHGHKFEDGVCTECGKEESTKPEKPGWGNFWDWIFGWWH